MIKKTYVDKKCIVCGEMFSRKPMYSSKQWELAKFCSKKCWNIRGQIQTKKCNFCKKEFSLPANLMRLGHKRERRACSLVCAHNLTTAEKSYLWKGEKRPYGTRFRTALANTIMYRKWREEIKKRDNNRCVNCLEQKEKLHVHHIYPLNQIIKDEKWSMDNFMNLYKTPESRLWKVANGVTICEDCHNSLISFALQSKGFSPSE
jgi:hypothetical protein